MTLPPGATVGIVGGGQLGRMLAIAAAQLGFRAHVYDPQGDSPAGRVAAASTCGAFDDADALAAFGGAVDVATYEFENIPAAALEALARAVPLHPPARAIEIAQDRVAEKEFVSGLGGRPAPYRPVASREELTRALDALGCPALLKTRRLGYDGKGQARIASPEEAGAAWSAVGGQPSVLEAWVGFEAEFSILLCRGACGATAMWDAPRNVHLDGILDRSIVPGGPSIAEAAAEAAALSLRIADALDYVGVLALEYFACRDGPVFNEMAPRVHNSGHWTIEGAATSQFENHVRAVAGLPLGDTRLLAPRVEMTNLIGGRNYWGGHPDAGAGRVHLYGKGEPRAGRKMGHLTTLG